MQIDRKNQEETALFVIRQYAVKAAWKEEKYRIIIGKVLKISKNISRSEQK